MSIATKFTEGAGVMCGMFHVLQGRILSFIPVKQSVAALSFCSIVLPSCSQSVHQIHCMKRLTDCSPAKSLTKKKKTKKHHQSQNKQRTLTTTMGRHSLGNTYSPLNEAGFPFHGLLADFWRLPLPGISSAVFTARSPSKQPSSNGT